MQISDMLLLLSAILLFIPSLLLSTLYLIDARKQEGAERRTAFLGLVTFTLLTLGYAMWTVSTFFNILLSWPTPSFGGPVYATTLIALGGATLNLLACWTLAIARPEWLHDRKLILTIAGCFLWIFFFGSFICSEIIGNPNLFLTTNAVFQTLVFIFTMAFALLKATTEKTALILFAGLLIYSIPGIPLAYLLEIQHLTPLGVWLILIWYIIAKRGF